MVMNKTPQDLSRIAHLIWDDKYRLHSLGAGGLEKTVEDTWARGRCCMEREEVGARPTRDGFQAVRSNLGRPSSVIRLRIRTPILASVF